ncbi:hypothetical protein BLNAU_2262 [Blattamonas nauphoetae]|uniref:Protein kinase domain-containing protein n=1 Tax=Blattamonas nauphoetae TaxID=2049346 RepID=A0ABQ9YGF0_9EUKA|nr:hypothetical protein BLNAU_2262 [Blattamonas nauphoetae]
MTSPIPRRFSPVPSSLSERLCGNNLRSVENGLFGTVSSPLGTHLSFVCTNSSISECVNTKPEVNEEGTITEEDQNWSFPSSDQQKAFVNKIENYIFSNCSFTATESTQHFRMLYFGNFSGSLSLLNCKFSATVTSNQMYFLDMHAARTTLPHLLVDQCSTLYSRTDNKDTKYNQIETRYSVHHTFASSNFSSSADHTNARLLLCIDSAPFIQTANCIFEKQSTNESGAVISYLAADSILHLFDSLFSSNTAGTTGGVIVTYLAVHNFHRCIFRNNKATRGGAIFMYWVANYLMMEDCHFEANQATEYNSQNNSLTHHRGNDVHSSGYGYTSMTTNTIVGCTSTSELPKIGYYNSGTSNGPHPQQEILFPHPDTGNRSPPAEAVLFVEVSPDNSGPDCTKDLPCTTISSAVLKSSPTGFSLINLGIGTHPDGDREVSGSVGIVGKGWLTNSSAFSVLTTGGFTLNQNANFTLSGLSLKPSSNAVTLIVMSHPSSLRLSHFTVECLKEHHTSLFSLAAGTTVFSKCIFNTLVFSSKPAISISGTASVSFETTWFMVVERKSGSGSSCVDSISNGTISFTYCDFGDCRSSGRSGCLDFEGVNEQGTVSVTNVFFSNCSAHSSLDSVGNDLAFSPLTLKKLTIDENTRSRSPQPHILNGTEKKVIPYPSLYFTPNGYSHPVNARFNMAVPASQFPELKTLIENITVPGGSTSITGNGISKQLDPCIASAISLTLVSHGITSVQQSKPLLTVVDTAFINLDKTGLTFDYSIVHTPFVVLSPAARLRFHYLRIRFSDLELDVPFCRSSGTLNFELLTWDYPVQMTGCSFISCTGGSVTISTSQISNLFSTSNGAFLSAVGTSIRSTLSSFTNCTATNGGAFAVALSGNNTISFAHESTSAYATSFSDCKAIGDGGIGDEKGKGGAIFVEGTTSIAQPIIFSPASNKAARFTDNKAENGTDVFVADSVFSGIAIKDIKPFGGNSFSNEYRVVIEGREEEDWEDVQLLISLPTISVNGSVYQPHTNSMSGVDGDNCKWSSSYCATLGFGIGLMKQKFKDGTPIPQTISFLWNMTYNETKVDVMEQDITVLGTTSPKPADASILRSTVTIASESTVDFLFRVMKDGKLNVTNIDFVVPSSHGLFDGQDNAVSLTLTNISILCSDSLERTFPLIRTRKIPVLIENTQLGTSSSEIVGLFVCGVIDIKTLTTPSFSTLTLSNLCTKGSALIVVESESFSSMNGISFSNCSRSDSGAEFFLVRSSNLSSSINPSDWTSHFDETTLQTALIGQETSLSEDNKWFEASLLFFLLTPTDEIVVDGDNSEATEHRNCGSNRLRCSTLSSSFSSALSHSRSIITAHSSVSHTSPFTPSAPLTLQSSTNRQTVTISEAGSFLINLPSEAFTLSSLVVALASTCSSATLFSVAEGTLTLSAVQVGSSSSVTLGSTTTLISVQERGILTLTDSSFTNLVFSDASLGTLIQLSLGASFTTNTGTLLSSISSNGKGSLVFVCSSNLTNKAKEESFQKLRNELSADHIFNETERNWICGSESLGEPESLLYYFFSHTTSESSLFVSNEGGDHALCGKDVLPCSSLKHGFSSLKTSGSSLTLLSDTTLSSSLSPQFATQTITSKLNKKKITVKENGHFDLSSGLLSVSSVDFVGSSSTSNSDPRSISLFVVSGSSSLSVSSATFTSISNGGVGGIVLCTSSGSVDLQSVEIVDCNSGSSSDGRQIFIERDSFSSGDVVMKTVSISQTLPSSHKEIVLRGSDFDRVVTESSFSGSFGEVNELTADKMKEMWGIDPSRPEKTGPLSYFAFAHAGGPVHVSGDFWDHTGCGKETLPCQSFVVGHERLKSSDAESKLVIDSNLTLAGELVTKARTIRIESSGGESLSLSSAGQLKVSEGQLTLSSFDLELPSTLILSPFVVNGGIMTIEPTLTISHTGTAQSPTPLASPLFAVSSGSLTVTGTASSPHIFEFFSSTSRATILEVDGTDSPTASLAFCSFHHCSSANGPSGVMSLIGSAGTISLKNCHFEGNAGSTSKDVHASILWKDVLNRGTFAGSFSDSDLNHLVIGSEAMNDLLPFSILSVNAVSFDDSQCQFSSSACSSAVKSLSLCIQNETNGKSALRLIELETNSNEPNTLEVLAKRIELFGSEQTHTLGCAQPLSLLIVSTGSAFLHTLTLVATSPSMPSSLLSLTAAGSLSLESVVLDGGSVDFASSLILTTAGLLSLKGVAFSGVNLSSHSLMEASGWVEVDECAFSEISRSERSGSVLTATIDTSNWVKITNTDFENCEGDEEPIWVLLSGENEATFSTSSWAGSFNLSSPHSGVLVRRAGGPTSSEFSPHSLLYELYPRKGSSIVVTSSPGFLDHPLCGSVEMACLSVKRGIELTNERIVEVHGDGDVSDVLQMDGDVVTISGFKKHGRLRFVGQGRIVNNEFVEPDYLTIRDVSLDFSSSSLSDCAACLIEAGSMVIQDATVHSSAAVGFVLIEMKGETLKMERISLSAISFESTPFRFDHCLSVRLKDLNVSSCSTTSILSAAHVDSLSLDSCTFSGPPPLTRNGVPDEMCLWTTGFVQVESTNLSLRSTAFTSLSQGALFVNSSRVAIEGGIFHDNSPLSTKFPSLRHNLRCVGESEVTIGSLQGGDGSSTEWLWMDRRDNCSLKSNNSEIVSPFFVPTLNSSSSKVTLTKTKLSLALVGTLLIPCNLHLRMFEGAGTSDEKLSENKTLTISETQINETHLSVAFDLADVKLNPEYEWRSCILFGDKDSETEWIRVKMSRPDERKALAAQAMKWVIPVIVGSAVLLSLLFVVIIVLIRRGKRDKVKKEGLLAQQELNVDDDSILKVESFGMETEQCNAIFERDVMNVTKSEVTGQTKKVEETEGGGNDEYEIVEAVNVNDISVRTRVNKQDTLFNRLHKPQGQFVMNKLVLEQRLVSALRKIQVAWPCAELLLKMSPHWILFDSNGTMYLQETEQALNCGTFFESAQAGREATTGHEGQRWEAPEVAQKKGEVDGGRAAVFSLGLIIWEIETEEVPFKEMDAQNAQRQLGSGGELSMDEVESENLGVMIQKCLSENPKERPTLSELSEFLEKGCVFEQDADPKLTRTQNINAAVVE